MFLATLLALTAGTAAEEEVPDDAEPGDVIERGFPTILKLPVTHMMVCRSKMLFSANFHPSGGTTNELFMHFTRAQGTTDPAGTNLSVGECGLQGAKFSKIVQDRVNLRNRISFSVFVGPGGASVAPLRSSNYVFDDLRYEKNKVVLFPVHRNSEGKIFLP